jgi:adenine-specific DNA methylase
VVTKKGQPKASIAAFPEVPGNGVSNDCTFRIVKREEWRDCRWPAPDFDSWHPKNTPTFKDGKAICPRCGKVMDGDEVKAIARTRTGGLPSQMYAVVSKVPVKLTYKNGDEKVRYMWRFRSPIRKDLDAVRRAEIELDRLLPGWEGKGLVPDEDIHVGDKTKEPLNMGINRWRDLFLPRQLLTIMVILEEIKKAQAQAYEELPEDEAQAVSVYLAFILSKVVNYNSVNTFWHYGRKTVTQTFSRHDFAFRPAFCEFEGARETVMWAAEQVMGAYDELARLIHGADADDDSFPLRSEVIVPSVTCEDAAALSTPAPGTVHLICVDPPYYNNVQYSELSNFFYVWLKRSLGDIPGLEHLFQEPLAESNREAVANSTRWAKEAEQELAEWQEVYNKTFETLRSKKVKAADAKIQALEAAGEKPMTAKERSDRFYEDKMASVFRRAKQLLHPAGRMVVMFNHKQTWAWRSLGMALIRAGFEVRSSAPIHTEAESSLNIRGLDAARSTVLLLCLPREDREQPVGNWGGVQNRVASTARNAAIRFEKQGLSGTDLYLSALGPALGEVGRNWPVTDYAGRPIDLVEALDQAYFAVGQWRLEQILENLTKNAELGEAAAGFTAEGADRDTQTLWLWLDTFQGDTAHSDDVRKLAKSLGVNPDDFNKMGLLKVQKELFIFRSPQEVDLRLLSKKLKGEAVARGREAREADIWEERVFPGFLGAAVWNAISLMIGTGQGPAGIDAVRRWLGESGYGTEKEFFGAFAVTMFLLEKVFANRAGEDSWHEASIQARRAWDLLLSGWRV